MAVKLPEEPAWAKRVEIEDTFPPVLVEVNICTGIKPLTLTIHVFENNIIPAIGVKWRDESQNKTYTGLMDLDGRVMQGESPDTLIELIDAFITENSNYFLKIKRIKSRGENATTKRLRIRATLIYSIENAPTQSVLL
jgi:hypothetical protein